ncbi:MAG: alpha/beta hydrolase [Limnohabitans sp.]|nr:alpha/beta hydrolase [Limnohabitans sp.]
MQIQLQQQSIYVYTGGKPLIDTQPTVIFLHGVLNDHSVWILQSRFFANHGWNVLAVDLPGHGKSTGLAPTIIEEGAQFVKDLMSHFQLNKAVLIGHSGGSLIALEAASQLQEKISKLVLIGTAFPMAVSQTLLDLSLNEPHKAIEMINVFSRSTLSAPPSALGPGTWVYGANRALNRRILQSNPHENVFHKGFMACHTYTNGLHAIKQITCPVLFILGKTDQMTQPKFAKKLIEQAKIKNQHVQVIEVPGGHHQMNETPEETLKALREFLIQIVR